MLIVPVPALIVKLVEVAAFHAVPAPTKVNVPEPNVNERAVEFAELNIPTLKLKLFKLTPPALSVSVLLAPIVVLSSNVKAPPLILTVTGQSIVFPLVVMFWFALPWNA